MHAMRFGVHVIGPSNGGAWTTFARRAESLGFSVLTVPDHLIDGCISPFAALGVVAEATSTLRIGTLVLNNDLRHPALVAREVLALDLLSRGRVELGLGAGSTMSAAEHESLGVSFDSGPTRVARLAEAVEVLDQLLRGESVTFRGEHYTLNEHRAWPPPTQRPRPPILVGGSGARVLQAAAVRADIVSLSGIGPARSRDGAHEISGFSPAAVDARTASIHAASTGRDVELQALVQRVVVTSDARTHAEHARQLMPELSVDDVLATPYLWIGTVDSICENLLAARDRWGFSYFTVFNDALDAAAPVVARLSGS